MGRVAVHISCASWEEVGGGDDVDGGGEGNGDGRAGRQTVGKVSGGTVSRWEGELAAVSGRLGERAGPSRRDGESGADNQLSAPLSPPHPVVAPFLAASSRCGR